jgi:hypothetical protein
MCGGPLRYWLLLDRLRADGHPDTKKELGEPRNTNCRADIFGYPGEDSPRAGGTILYTEVGEVGLSAGSAGLTGVLTRLNIGLKSLF